jgi:hypothetical protein
MEKIYALGIIVVDMAYGVIIGGVAIPLPAISEPVIFPSV